MSLPAPSALVFVALLTGLASAGSGQRTPDPPAGDVVTERSTPVVVASKPFSESYLLGEIFAQLLEARGYAVERRLGLGATEIAFQALRSGSIDVYPEYSGTGLLAILDEEVEGDGAREVFLRVQRAFRQQWGIHWLPPLGFENRYAIAVRRESADRLDLRTLSDLARASDSLVAGFTPDFIGRPDGLPGIREEYGLEFASVRSLLQAVKYRALSAGEVDVIDGYSTDGLVSRYDLVVLDDDRGFFPPYEASALVGERLWTVEPGAVRALTELSGLLTESAVRGWNERIEVDGEPLADVAASALRSLGVIDRDGAGGRQDSPGAPPRIRADESLASYLWQQRAELLAMTGRHLLLVGVSLGAAIAVSVPLGIGLHGRERWAEGVIRGFGALETIPSIALLAFAIPLLGIGVVPALVALFLYSLFPILRNTYSGVRDVDADIVGAARSLGMTAGQLLVLVRLPLATPTIMAGVRTAAIINVGTATLAAFIGAGGLGDPIVSGLALSDTRMILSGAIPAAVLALVIDGALGVVERLLAPGGLDEG